MKAASAQPGHSTEALLALLRAADSVWASSRLFFERWDISPSQFNVLNLLRARPDGLSQTELGRQLIMHRSNVTGLVDRLERAGLVSRRDVALDRRAYNVVLTSSGSGLVDRILPEFYAAAERLWSVLPASRLEGITADLRCIGENAPVVVEAFERGTGRHRGKGKRNQPPAKA